MTHHVILVFICSPSDYPCRTRIHLQPCRILSVLNRAHIRRTAPLHICLLIYHTLLYPVSIAGIDAIYWIEETPKK